MITLSGPQKHDYAQLGAAHREHLNNEIVILETVQRMAGQPLMTLAVKITAFDELQYVDDWQVGLLYLNEILKDEVTMINLPGKMFIP